MLYSSQAPHVRQSDKSRNCGAACLLMLFQKYNTKGTLKDITQAVSITMPGGIPSCRNNLLVLHALSKKFDCCCVSATTVRDFIDICKKEKLDVILSYNPSNGKPYGHMVLVTGSDNTGVFVNDPQIDNGKNVKIEYSDLERRMMHIDGSNELVKDNTCIVLSPTKSGHRLEEISCTLMDAPHQVQFFHVLSDHISAVLDPLCIDWYTRNTPE